MSKAAAAEDTSLRYMFALAGPMIITTISFTVMQFVDRFMVSRLGTDALAAILPAGVASFLPASFAIGVIAAVGTFVSQSLGRGEREKCSSYCWQSIWMGLVYFGLVIMVMWPLADELFTVLGHEPEVVALEVVYLRIVLLAQVPAVLIWSSSQFFIGIHRPMVVMYAALAGQVVNIGANYVLIFGKLGLPVMGIAGAAWGTFLGIAVGATIRMGMFLSLGVHRDYGSRSSVAVQWHKMLDLLKVGVPTGLELLVNVSLWGMLLLGFVGTFGKEPLASTSAVFSCANVSVMPVIGLRMALTVAVGKAIGARRKETAVKQTAVCLKVALFYMGSIGLAFLLFRERIMGFWSSDSLVIASGAQILIFAAIYQVFHAVRIIYSGSLRGAGDTLWVAIMSGLGSVGILGAGGWAMVEFFPGLGPAGSWSAATASIVAVGLANRWRFKSNRWREIDLFSNPTVVCRGE